MPTARSWVAIDEGVLVKTGSRGLGLGASRPGRHAIWRSCATRSNRSSWRVDEQEQNVRQVMARLEAGFLRRYARLST